MFFAHTSMVSLLPSSAPTAKVPGHVRHQRDAEAHRVLDGQIARSVDAQRARFVEDESVVKVADESVTSEVELQIETLVAVEDAAQVDFARVGNEVKHESVRPVYVDRAVRGKVDVPARVDARSCPVTGECARRQPG